MEGWGRFNARFFAEAAGLDFFAHEWGTYVANGGQGSNIEHALRGHIN